MKCLATAFLASLMLSFTSYVHAGENIPAFFILESLGSDFNLDLELWRRSAQGNRIPDLVRTYGIAGRLQADQEKSLIEQARRDAASAGAAPNIIVLSTANLQDKNSAEFQDSVAKVKQDFQNNPKLKGAKVLFEQPMCMLFEKPPQNRNSLPASMLMVLNDARAKSICYTAVQEYFTTAPGPDGNRVAPVVVDSVAIAMQMAMPRMRHVRTFLADKTQRNSLGGFAERESNVYALGEEVFIVALLDHVGRKMTGTPFATYEIGLDIEVRDHDGKIIKAIPNAHTYQGRSTPRFPVDAEYFSNHATAGITIRDRGDFKVAFIFTDRSRPGNETAPVKAEFDVKIE